MYKIIMNKGSMFSQEFLAANRESVFEFNRVLLDQMDNGTMRSITIERIVQPKNGIEQYVQDNNRQTI